MAESQNDDLADALARMAGGDVAPSEHEPSAPLEPDPAPAAPPPKPARPAVARPVSIRPSAPVPAAAPKPRPVAPVPAKPQRPAAPVLSSAPPAPVAPVAPVAPATAAPMAKKQRPSAPTIRQVTIAPTDAEADGGQSTGLTGQADPGAVIDDDDAMLAPAPEASVFMPKKKPATSAEARAVIQRKKNLEYRRTLIPILLTSGTMMLIFGVLKFFTGPDSMLQNLPGWISITLLCAGAVVLALAGANMMSVKQQLAAEQK